MSALEQSSAMKEGVGWHSKDYILLGCGLFSLIPTLFPLLGIYAEPDVVLRLQVGWLAPRDSIVRASVTALAASLPLFIDLYFEFFSSYKSRFWPETVMLISTVLPSFLLLLADWAQLDDMDFTTCFFVLSLVRGNLMSTALISYIQHVDVPADFQQLICTSSFAGLLISMARLICLRFESVQWIALLNVANVINQLVFLTESVHFTFLCFSGCYRYSGILIAALLTIWAIFGQKPEFFAVWSIYLHLFKVMLVFYWSKRFHQNEHVHVEDLLASKRAFVRYIAHEMRTPLNVSSIGMQLARSALRNGDALRSGTDVDVMQVWDLLKDSSVALEETLDTLNELLIFDKVECNLLQLDKEDIMVKPLLEETFRSFVPQAFEKDIIYKLDLSSEILDAEIHADKKKMMQAIRNYISNALKFTPQHGSVLVRASLKPHSADSSGGDQQQTLRFEVIDTGPGISENNLKKVFHEVVQFDAAKLQNGGGSGLGLTITDAIIRYHDGVVGVQSSLGIGSTFFFEIAAHISHKVSIRSDSLSSSKSVGSQATELGVAFLSNDEFEVASPIKEISHIRKQYSSLSEGEGLTSGSTAEQCLINRVLIVDDSSLNLKMMGKFLDPFVNHCVMANNGIRGAAVVDMYLTQGEANQVGEIDLVLTDYHMPEMDGFQMSSLIRSHGYKGVIVLVTGDNLDPNDEELKKHGIDMLLAKPIQIKDIQEIVLKTKLLIQSTKIKT